MKKSYFVITMMIIMLFVIVACSSVASTPPLGEGETILVQNPYLNEIIELKPVETMVSLAPAITQILEDLGVKKQLIAVDNTSPFYVEGLEDLPLVDILTPDMETLLALDPDIVFASEISFGMNPDIFRVLKNAGISVVEIPTSDSLIGIKVDIQFIADCLQLSHKGYELTDTMLDTIEIISEIGKQVEHPRTVLFEISPLPEIYSFGADVFLHEMIEIIGAKNVLENQSGWLPLTEEAAVEANPDVILTNVNFIDDPVAEILSRRGWVHVTAVTNEAVYKIDNMSSSLPNHRIVDSLMQMAKAVYPEVFAVMDW